MIHLQQLLGLLGHSARLWKLDHMTSGNTPHGRSCHPACYLPKLHSSWNARQVDDNIRLPCAASCGHFCLRRWPRSYLSRIWLRPSLRLLASFSTWSHDWATAESGSTTSCCSLSILPSMPQKDSRSSDSTISQDSNDSDLDFFVWGSIFSLKNLRTSTCDAAASSENPSCFIIS